MKNDVLPYCVFSAGEGGTCLTAVHYPGGRMLLGQGVYAPRAFFQHNFIIPPDKAGEALAVMFDTVFITERNAAQRGILPALESLPSNGGADTRPLSYDFSVYDIPFLIHCLTQSAASHKKTYIRTPPGDTHPFALALLTYIYPLLPVPLRHVLGFCTHTSEALNKKGIHLLFTNNPQLKGDFLIDFAEKSGIINPVESSGDFFAVRYAGMTDARFCERIFNEIDFWRVREPAVIKSEGFRKTVCERVTHILNASAVLPERFIAGGKAGKYADIIGHSPADFVAADILRQVSLLRPSPDELRYLAGSYRLSPAARGKLQHVLQGEGFSCITSITP
jgi:hypothetical protein